LLVVTVVAIVRFQTWYNTYSSVMQNNVEQTSAIDSNFQIESIIGGKLYLKNNAEIVSVKVNGNNCFVSGWCN